MTPIPERVGRWALGDIARDRDGKLYAVIGFITNPAVIFREVNGAQTRVEVAGCLNEMRDLQHFQLMDDGAETPF